MITFGSLFSGIGGMDLGLERAGMICKWQVEIDDYATRVLKKHWPGVPKYRDIRECSAENLANVDLIAGGFPCQPHSVAGKRKASADERDLWGEFARIIRELRPKWVLAENVPGLLSSDNRRFFGRVLRDLAESGYDAEWSVLSACAMGAPHTRERLFIVAYSQQQRGVRGRICESSGTRITESKKGTWAQGTTEAQGPDQISRWWSTEPSMARVAARVPRRMDRIRGLGNSVVPAVAEFVGSCILDADQRMAL